MKRVNKATAMLIAVLCMMMIPANCAYAAYKTTTGTYSFSFDYGGDSQRSTDLVKKTKTTTFMNFQVDSYRNSTGKSLYARGRSSSDDAATELGTITGSTNYYLYYLNGYGTQNAYYRVKAQTSSSSTRGSASISGTFTP